MDEPVAPDGGWPPGATTPGTATPAPTPIGNPDVPTVAGAPTDAELASYRCRVTNIAAAVTARTPREQVALTGDGSDELFGLRHVREREPGDGP